MNVKIRKRALKEKGRFSLYLDIYSNGKQTQETLGLYVENEKNNPTVKQQNKDTMEIARKVQADRLRGLQHNIFGYKAPVKCTQTFNEYFGDLVSEKKRTGVNYEGWLSAHKQLNKFKSNIGFFDITEELLEHYKCFLLKNLKQNTALSYFSKIKAAVHKAYRANLINNSINPAERVSPPRQVDTNREYLTAEEVEKLLVTDCRYEVLKRAFLFSCLTGLRWSDIHKLTWREVRNINGQWHIIYTQKKTKNSEVLPISNSAYNLLGTPQEDDERVFVGLKYSAYHNTALFTWVSNAGIKKHITFHCARHTNAVLLLNSGADIYTVSNMLGHREIKTTQIYAKVLNKTKVDAVGRLPKFELQSA